MAETDPLKQYLQDQGMDQNLDPLIGPPASAKTLPTEAPQAGLRPIPILSSGTERLQGDEGHILLPEQQAAQREANKTGMLTALGYGFETGSNMAVSLAKELSLKSSSGRADPAWQNGGYKQWLKDNAAKVDQSQAWRYTLTDNMAQANGLLAQSLDTQQKAHLLQLRSKDYPISTGVAQFLPGIADIDLPIAIFSGGYSAEAKLAIAGSRWGRMAVGAAAGAASGAAVTEGAYLSDPTSDWAMVPLAGLAGAALGGLFGAASRANVAKTAVEREFGDNLADDLPRSKNDYRKPDEGMWHRFKTDQDEIKKQEAQAEIDKEQGVVRKPTSIDPSIVQPSNEGSSVGARQVNGISQPVNSISSTKSVDHITDAKTWARVSRIPQEWFDNLSGIDAKFPVIGKYARRFQDYINASPIASDFARAMRSNSAVLQRMAFNLYENGPGIIRNHKNAAMLMNMYKQRLQNEVKELPDRMQAWMKEKGYNSFAQHTNPKATKEWDEALISELQYRQYKTGQATTNEHIKAAADAVDRWSARELEVRKGRPGEVGEFGTDTMVPKSGYFPQIWNGQQFRRLKESGRTYKDIHEAISEIYGMMHPAMKPADRDIWAKALVDRARRTGEGISMNVRNVMDGDGRTAINDFLLRQGNMNQHDIDALIDRLTGNMETAGQKGNTKRRIDVDLRMTASNGIRMLDLIEHDVYGVISRRSHQAAGAGALARKGIDSRAKFNELVDAALEEQSLTSIPKAPSLKNPLDMLEHQVDKDRHLTREEIEDMFGIFLGRRQEGAISPGIQRALKLTSLGLLGQVGITSIAEFGPAMAAKGFSRFIRDLPEDIQAAWKHPDSDLSKELRHFGVMEPEENLFRYDTVYNAEKAATEEAELWSRFDTLLNKGGRLQGFTSLMFQIRRVQHKMAVTTAVDRIFNHLKGDTTVNPLRMRDWGFTPQMEANLKKYVDNGTVEFENGSVKRLNLDKWDMGPKLPGDMDTDDLILAINRITDQQVQKAVAGESSTLFRKGGLAALFWQLKSFPMLAIEKQTMRHLRIADDESVGMLMYSLAFAGLAYGTKQLLNGNTDRLNTTDIMKGAFNMSNVTGWIPMFTDPVASMFGMQGINGGYGRDSSPISQPAAMSYLGDLLQLPGAVGALVNPFVEGSNTDVNLLHTIPIFGRMAVLSGVINAMKDGPKPHKEKEPAPVEVPKPTKGHKAIKNSSLLPVDNENLAALQSLVNDGGVAGM